MRRRHCERWTGVCPCSGNNRKLVVVVWPTDLAHSLTQSASAAVTQFMGAIIRHFRTLEAERHNSHKNCTHSESERSQI